MFWIVKPFLNCNSLLKTMAYWRRIIFIHISRGLTIYWTTVSMWNSNFIVSLKEILMIHSNLFLNFNILELLTLTKVLSSKNLEISHRSYFYLIRNNQQNISFSRTNRVHQECKAWSPATPTPVLMNANHPNHSSSYWWIKNKNWAKKASRWSI